MKQKKEKENLKMTVKSKGCCAVKAMVTIDERGQMVLPKELRDEVGLKPGDKLAVIAMAEKGRVCCLALMKADELSHMVMIKLGPVLKEMKGSDKNEEE